MFTGTLIAESLRDDAGLAVPLTCLTITRVRPAGATPDQSPTWTIIEFEVPDDRAGALASALAEALDEPGWYADLRSDAEVIVAFPRRCFRYPRGDSEGRSEAAAYARSLSVPERQLDWPV